VAGSLAHILSKAANKGFCYIHLIIVDITKFTSLCVFLNWAGPLATIVAKTASIVAGGGQYNTNRLTKNIRLILQIGISFNGP
jgi:hypothetical protein